MTSDWHRLLYFVSHYHTMCICSLTALQCLCLNACVLLEEISQVKQSSVMLRVDVQCFPVVVLSFLWALSQSAKIVHGAGMAGV